MANYDVTVGKFDAKTLEQDRSVVTTDVTLETKNRKKKRAFKTQFS